MKCKLHIGNAGKNLDGSMKDRPFKGILALPGKGGESVEVAPDEQGVYELSDDEVDHLKRPESPFRIERLDGEKMDREVVKEKRAGKKGKQE